MLAALVIAQRQRRRVLDNKQKGIFQWGKERGNGAIYIFGEVNVPRARKKEGCKTRLGLNGVSGFNLRDGRAMACALRLSRITVIFRRQKRKANFIAAVPDAKGRAGRQVCQSSALSKGQLYNLSYPCLQTRGRGGCSTRTAVSELPSCTISNYLPIFRPTNLFRT